jgi:hypothetical protein
MTEDAATSATFGPIAGPVTEKKMLGKAKTKKQADVQQPVKGRNFMPGKMITPNQG